MLSINKIFKSILVTSIIIYYGKGVIYSDENSIISILSLGGFLSVSSIYFFRMMLEFPKLPFMLKIWTLFFISNIFLFIYTGNIDNNFHYSFFVGTLTFMLSIYPFYTLTLLGIFRVNDLKILFLFIMPMVLLAFFEQSTVTNLFVENYKLRKTNNISYFIVALMPLLFFFKKKVVVLFIYTALILLLFISLKRGAIISGAIIFAMYIYDFLSMKTEKTFVKSILVLIGFSISLWILYQFILIDNQVILRFNALDTDRGSYRELIWASIFSGWFSANELSGILFGLGYASSLNLSNGFFAHNDFLEILSSLGTFGLLLYLLLIFSAVRQWIKSSQQRSSKIVWGAIILSWISISMYSMWYSTLHFIPISITIAYLLANESTK